MVINAGIVGVSEGNGHPYSFAAILNGYDREKFRNVGWEVIFDYLERKDPADFGVNDMKISCVWTPDATISQKIAAATNIPTICSTLIEMIEIVDVVIVARDDWESHASIALPFLKAGKYVFVDKPLSLSVKELREFLPYLQEGKLMSCAALRYAVELDYYREDCKRERPKFIQGTILADWERYGVHLLDGIFSGIDFNVESVYSSGAKSRSTILNCSDGSIVTLNCVGSTEKTFNFSTYSNSTKASYDVIDNFTAFRRTLAQFRNMIVTGEPSVPPDLTINIMKTLIAGNISKAEDRVVYLDEISI